MKCPVLLDQNITDFAHACLKDILSPFTEALPLNVYDKTFYLHNILVNAKTDEALSEYSWSNGEPIDVKKIVIDVDDAADKEVFRSALHGYGGIFCSEGFKQTCEEFDLEGLVFL